jgi:hypothetical protein
MGGITPADRTGIDLRVLHGSVDDAIIHETNEGLHKLQEEFRDLAEISRSLGEMTSQQEQTLEQVVERTETAAKNVIEGTNNLKVAAGLNLSQLRLKLYAGGGAAAGFVAGLAVFAINPVVGLVAIPVLTSAGAAAGAVASSKSK